VSTPKTEGSTSGRALSPVEGKVEKDLSYFKGTLSDNPFEVAIRGEKLVLNATGDWLTPAEFGAETQVSKLRQTLRKPGEEITKLWEDVGTWKKDGDTQYSGDLQPSAAKALFALLGRRAAAAPSAEGLLKVWVKDGQLARYEVRVKGKITAGEEKKEVEISRTITVEIRNVGSTKIELPEQALKKL
jgi:hypothetical protein